MKRTGIYCITNTKNRKIYIGQSIDIKKRISQHKQALRKNRHFNQYLQNSWNKNGESKFLFSILSFCNENKLDENEQYWIDELSSCNSEYGYNICAVAVSNYRNGQRIETKKKLSEIMKKYWDGRNISYQRRKNISDAAKGGWKKRYETRRMLRKDLNIIGLDFKRKITKLCTTPPCGYRRDGKYFVANEYELYIIYRILYMFRNGYSARQIKDIFDNIGVLFKGKNWSRKTINTIAQRHLDGKIYK